MNEDDLQPLYADERTKAERIANLIYRFILSETTDDENEELDEWISEQNDNAGFFKDLASEDYIEYIRALSAEGRPGEAINEIVKATVLFMEVRNRREKNKWLLGAVLIFFLIVITIFIIKR